MKKKKTVKKKTVKKKTTKSRYTMSLSPPKMKKFSKLVGKRKVSATIESLIGKYITKAA